MNILLPTLHVRPSAQATPLAAAGLKAALPEMLRSKTTLLDFFLNQPAEEMLGEILRRQPALVAFPLYLWNRQPVIELARQLRRRCPEIFLVAGGPEASADTAAVLTEGRFDAVIRGEGEEAFARLVQRLQQRGSIAELAGVCSSAGQVPAAVHCLDLGQLPSPYLNRVLKPEPGGGLLWEVARGCPFDCSFCYDAKGQQGVRPFPFERLKKELQLFAASGVEQVWVLDSTFNFPAERGRRLLELLLETAPQLHYHLEAKAELLDQATVELLARLHCSVQIGLQSADPQVLKPLQRSLQTERLFERLQSLSAAGVVFGIDLIYGLPGDSYQGFCRSLDRALECMPNQVDVFPLAVLPGTRLYREQRTFGLRAQQQPPYEILAAPGYPETALESSRQLAAATDIFYNRGRAVGFFLAACEACQLTPSRLLEEFGRWLQAAEPPIVDAEGWFPEQILPLQREFLAAELQKRHRACFHELLDDLLSYHYHYAETLLGPELPPGRQTELDASAWRQAWRCTPELRLVDFHYELEELQALGGVGLTELYRNLRPTGSTGLFFRRGQEIFCESLQDDFRRLLQGADGRRTAADLLPHLGAEEGMELLEFALREGLLQAG